MDGCKHLNNFKLVKGIQPYETIHSIFVACTSAEARKTKALYCYCHSCKKIEQRLHSCLHCIYFGCSSNGHIQEHARTKKHFLVVDLAYGNILCFQCGDYIYDSALAEVAETNLTWAAASLGISPVYNSWAPTPAEVQLLQSNPRVLTLYKDSMLGLRGLLNLGNTCFMNSVMQALAHTPLLRDYFLSDRHECQLQDPPGQCLVCEVMSLFQEFYSGRKSPLLLSRLLHLIWMHAHHLTGYKQQDAHEFLMAILDLLHRHFTAKTTIQPQNCSCIIDQIFTGSLQSDIVCTACSGVSTTIDPIRDFSLDLATCVTGDSLSLLECLQQFTSAEHLKGIRCNSCDQNEAESTKQLTVNTLPMVACFHLKRFEGNKYTSKKILTKVGFPQELDMSPFMSHKRNALSTHGPLTLEDNRYSLFAVINHEGTSLENGHYIAYIRQQHRHWYQCNDHMVTRAHVNQVLDSEGYLLFYHKKILEFE